MPIPQITQQEAHALLQQGARYIDVRTEAEFANGHPAGGVNIPVVVPDAATGGPAINQDFLTVVAAHFPRDARLVIGCQSGGRSQRAAEMLAGAGYTDVANMQGGFGGLRDATGQVVAPGWAACGLPVCADCSPTASYAHLRSAAGGGR